MWLAHTVPTVRFILRINSEWIKTFLTLEVVHIYKLLNNVWLLKMFYWDWEMAPRAKEVLAAQRWIRRRWICVSRTGHHMTGAPALLQENGSLEGRGPASLALSRTNSGKSDGDE